MASQNARTCLTCLPAALALTALVPFAASAGEPDDLAAPIPITSPYHEPLIFQGNGPKPLPAEAWTVFTNFDGANMNSCGWGDNSPQDNCSTIFDGTVLPFSGNAAQRAAVVQVIRADLGQFNINVVDKRPVSGDYDMEMIGDWNPAPQGGFAGVAPSLDCWNDNGGEVSFTLDYTGTATGIAKAVLQEIAHTWGLEHVDSKSDLLYPTTQSIPDPSFQDVCNPIVRLDDKGNTVPEDWVCAQQHSQFCGLNQQNSYRELLQIFGPGVPDLTAPTLEITSPADGSTVDPSFELAMHVEDNQSPQLLVVNIAVEGPDSFTADPTSWASPSDLTFPIAGVKPGEYTITATVVDEYDNEALDVVTFTVKGAPPDPTTTGTTTTEGGTTESPTTGEPATTGEPETTADPGDDTGVPDPTSGPATGGGSDDDDAGCNCRTDAVPGAPGLLLLLGLFGARRRARR
jgi:MYXO-CTERM domain-containing protein